MVAASGLYEVREIKPSVFVWIPEDILDQDCDPLYSRTATAGFIITQHGVVVVDTTNSPFHARELLYEIRKRTDLPVKYVVNTGARGDHVLGNEVFADQQATIVSSARAQAEMRRYQQELQRRLVEDWRLQARMRGVHVTLPTQTFEGEMALHVDGREIRLLNFDTGPRSGDIAVHLPEAKILFLGDLFENAFFPRVGWRDIRRWIETLRQVENWEVETYVPSHGLPGEKKQLAEFRGYLEWLLAAVQTRIRLGETLTQVKREVLPLDTFHWRAPELAAPAVEAVYQQLIEQPSATTNPKATAPGS